MEKFIYYNELYLIYKDLFTDKSKDIFNLYYGENLTMQEIADLRKLSKARVGIIIKNMEKKLSNYESILHNYERQEELKKICELEDINKIKSKLNTLIKGE